MPAKYSKFQVLGYIVPINYYWPVLIYFSCTTEVSKQCPADILLWEVGDSLPWRGRLFTQQAMKSNGEKANVLCEMQSTQLSCWRCKADGGPLTVMLLVETHRSFVTDFDGIKRWIIPYLVLQPRNQPPSAEFQSWWFSFETFIYPCILLWLFM